MSHQANENSGPTIGDGTEQEKRVDSEFQQLGRSFGMRLRRNLIWAFPVAALSVCVGVCVVLLTVVPEYGATHILQFNNDFVLGSDLANARLGLADNERPIIMSPEVLSDVLDDPQLRAAPSLADPNRRENEIRNRVTVSDGGTNALLTITYRDTDGQMAATVVNAIAESYRMERLRYDVARIRKLEKSLIQPIEMARRNVLESRNLYQSLYEKVHGRDPFAQEPGPLEGGDLVADEEQAKEQSRLVDKGLETSELLFVKTHLDEQVELYDKLTSRLSMLRAELTRPPSVVTRSVAKPSSVRVDKTPVTQIVLVGGFAFVLPFLLAAIASTRDFVWTKE